MLTIFIPLAFALVMMARPAVAQTPLSCGQVVNGTIAAPLELDQFTFFGEQGDIVTLTLVQTGAVDPGFAAFGHRFTPSGGGPLALGQGIANWTLPETGTYTVRIFDLGNTRRGSYSLRLAWLLPLAKQCGDRTSLSCGQLSEGSIATPLEQDQFTFFGGQADIVTLTLVQTGAVDPGFAAFGHRFTPSGSGPLALGQGVANWTLPQTGTYTVRIFDLGNTRRGSYSLRLSWLGPCPSPPPALSPGPPTSLTASVAGSTVTLNWMAPSTGGAVTSYVLEAGVAPGDSSLTVFDTGLTLTSFVALSVVPGAYFVRVKARNSLGTSAASNEVVILVGAGGCVVPPAAPSGLAAGVNGQAVTLSWTAPGGPLTTYVIEAGSSFGASNIANFSTGNTGTSLMAIAAPGTYFVRIRARNTCGTSGPSNEVAVTVF